MATRYFKRQEVDALIPALSRIMGALMKAHAEAAERTAWLQGEQQRIAMAGGGMIDRREWERAKAEIARLTEAVRGGLEEIGALGGTPKDLGLGLVDFPARRSEEDVNLCWRYGESEVRFWHGLDEGYAGRKPL